MGVKWTCALFCLLGIIHLSVGAKMRNQRALDGTVEMHRVKRDAAPESQKQGRQNQDSNSATGNGRGYSWSSSSSSGSSGGGGSAGGGGSWSSSGSGSGYAGAGNNQFQNPGSDWSQYQYPGFRNQGFQNPGQAWSQQAFQRPNIPDSDYRNYIPNVGSYPYYPNQNSGPYNVPNFDFEDFLQQYFRNLNFQQRQFESQFQNRFQPGRNSWAHAAASMTSPNGGAQPDAMVYANSWSSSGTTGQSNLGAGHSWHHYNAPNQAVINQQRFSGQNNRLEYGSPFNNFDQSPNGFGNRGAFGPDFGNFDGFNRGFPNSAVDGSSNFFSQSGGGHSATASASIGPDGGYQKAEVSPSSPGNIKSRFAEQVPPSNGQSFGTFSSTSTFSETDSNGKQKYHKTATTGINNNGKVTYHTVSDP